MPFSWVVISLYDLFSDPVESFNDERELKQKNRIERIDYFLDFVLRSRLHNILIVIRYEHYPRFVQIQSVELLLHAFFFINIVLIYCS